MKNGVMKIIENNGKQNTKFLNNTYHAAGVSRQQVKHFTIFKKMSKLLNFITIFGIAMENALK